MSNGENAQAEENEEHPVLLADDEFYRALAARPRRRALWHLLETGESSVVELADALCGWQVDSGGMVDQSEHARARVALEHQHLPVLQDVGLVRYDRDAGRVRPADMDHSVEDLVRRGIEAEQ